MIGRDMSAGRLKGKHRAGESGRTYALRPSRRVRERDDKALLPHLKHVAPLEDYFPGRLDELAVDLDAVRTRDPKRCLVCGATGRKWRGSAAAESAKVGNGDGHGSRRASSGACSESARCRCSRAGPAGEREVRMEEGQKAALLTDGSQARQMTGGGV